MLRITIFCSLLALGAANFCYSDVEGACGTRPTANGEPSLPNCNAKYGSFENLQSDLQGFANGHIQLSYEYLLMSTHFGNYESNREGFKALYRKLSDEAWDKAVDIIKYITKRGGTMNFFEPPHFKQGDKESRVLELNELYSLAKALDSQKQLAEKALEIHGKTLTHPKQDSAVGHYLEEEFMEPQAETIRTLAGYTSDLKSFLNRDDGPLAVFLFDEYLKKTL